MNSIGHDAQASAWLTKYEEPPDGGLMSVAELARRLADADHRISLKEAAALVVHWLALEENSELWLERPGHHPCRVPPFCCAFDDPRDMAKARQKVYSPGIETMTHRVHEPSETVSAVQWLNIMWLKNPLGIENLEWGYGNRFCVPAAKVIHEFNLTQARTWLKEPKDLPAGGLMSVGELVRKYAEVRNTPLIAAAQEVLAWLEKSGDSLLWLERPGYYPRQLRSNEYFMDPRDMKAEDLNKLYEPRERVTALRWLQMMWLEFHNGMQHLDWKLGSTLRVPIMQAGGALGIFKNTHSEPLHQATERELPALQANVASPDPHGHEPQQMRPENRQWSEAEKQEMQAARDRGESDTSIAKRYGFSRQRLAEVIGSRTKQRLTKATQARAQRAA